MTATDCGVKLEVGKTVCLIFKPKDPKAPAVAAQLMALAGKGTEICLTGNFANMFLRVLPLLDEASEIKGCISILNAVGS